MTVTVKVKVKSAQSTKHAMSAVGMQAENAESTESALGIIKALGIISAWCIAGAVSANRWMVDR